MLLQSLSYYRKRYKNTNGLRAYFLQAVTLPRQQPDALETLLSYFSNLEKELALCFYYSYNVLQINTTEAMYEQSIISKSHRRTRLKTI